MVGIFAGLLGRLTVTRRVSGPMGISTRINGRDIFDNMQHLMIEVGQREKINRKVAIQLYGWVMKNFDQEGAMQEPAWAPLAASTLKQKKARGYTSKPLIRTGNLRNAFSMVATADSAGVGARASAGVDYAQVHETGNSRVPKRSMLPPREYAKETALTIYNLELAKLIKSNHL